MSTPRNTVQRNGTSARNARNGANGAARADAGRGIRDQIRRYRSSFIAVITMGILAVVVGGYVLSQERLALPCGFPVLGQCNFKLSAYFTTAQALTPGQGQAVTIAGAKMGEIESVTVTNGQALVTMSLTPKYAHIYRNATLLMRPKTSLQDMTVQLDPGAPPAEKLTSGAVIPSSQTAPNINFDQFLASLDAETRAYLQELINAAGEGLKENGANLAAAYKRFDPLARNTVEITHELQRYHANIAGSIHNFTQVMQALAEVEKELAELVDSANRNFRVFASQQHAVERTLQLLPGALAKTQSGLGRLATATNVLAPTVAKLHPFAQALGPAEQASQAFLRTTTPIFRNEIRPFAREVTPVFAKFKPALGSFANALPNLTVSFKVLNELVNELGYNPGANQGGFLFFGDWLAHDINSVYSSADAHGAIGNTLPYFNCGLLSILEGAAKIDPTAKLLIGLFNFPRFPGANSVRQEENCHAAGARAVGARAASTGGGGAG
jgi:phospholipid/cholesterol/gamma-HCH transport system substrate-binding protein